jgi:hypothetical protein
MLAYLFSPLGLLFEYVILTGAIRVAGLVASGRPTGDPVITFLAWLRRLARGELRRRRRLRALGPWRPDRILTHGRELLVLSAREKPGWDERVTYEYEGAFYRLRRREDRAHDGVVDVAYLLRPREPGELIRSVVKVDAPPDAV